MNLNILFKVAGPLVTPDFEGVVAGHWSKAKRLVVVQVAVPEDIGGVDPSSFLAACLREVPVVARSMLDRRKVHSSFDPAERVVVRLVDSLAPAT